MNYVLSITVLFLSSVSFCGDPKDHFIEQAHRDDERARNEWTIAELEENTTEYLNDLSPEEWRGMEEDIEKLHLADVRADEKCRGEK